MFNQSELLGDRTIERDAAIEQRDSAQRAITELAFENALAERRLAIVQASRESILTAPDTDGGSVAPVLQQALDAADQIGGVK